ncbi:MAG: hypothetical protein ACI934_001484 [Pseudohongiellaceae bacterium]|jgi:uncharacterized protein (DUF924 family)|tara:strand:- start:2613 stop:3152 length:540 start_codon:yes stop_codon:yes gene_type:complete
MQASEIIKFWFEEIPSKAWFEKDSAFDQLIKERYLSFHQAAACGELYSWRDNAQGRLAEIIILDQFSRNIYRDQAQAFAWDNQVLVLAQEAVAHGALEELKVSQQAFLMMPYMHSESTVIHEQAVVLFSRPGLENNLDFELRHKEIIDRFGRYPHRNAILGRQSCAEEEEFLAQPGSSF